MILFQNIREFPATFSQKFPCSKSSFSRNENERSYNAPSPNAW